MTTLFRRLDTLTLSPNSPLISSMFYKTKRKQKIFRSVISRIRTNKNMIFFFQDVSQDLFAFILTSSGGTPVILLRMLLLLLNPIFCLLLSFKKTSSKVSNRCISISFLGDSSAKNFPFLIRPMMPACLINGNLSYY